MRRTPAIALVGLLLGLSGCAGVPQRLGWSTPTADRSDPADSSAPNRLTWWRQPRAENSTIDQSAKIAETPETTQPAVSNKLPTDVWPESRSEWFARCFPLLNRRLNGTPATAAVDDDARLRELNARLLARWSAPPTASAGREDDDVRPVDSTAENASSDRQATAGQRAERMPPLSPTPLVVGSRPHSLPDTSGDVVLDINQAELAQASQAAPPDEVEVASADSTPASTSSAGTSPAVAMPADGRRSIKPPANSRADAALETATAMSDTPDVETSLAQAPAQTPSNTQPPSSIPPAPPPVRPTAPPSPPVGGDKPAANPIQTETPTTPAADAAKPDLAEQTPPQPAPAPSTAETPSTPPQTAVSSVITTSPPPATSAASPALGVSQRIVSGSSQVAYASPPPMAPPRPRHKFFGLFFVQEAPQPLASPQLPPAMFPASYHVQTPPPAPIPPASQAIAAPAPAVCSPPSKPCVLSALFQKIKSCGKRLGCSGCHHDGSAPCCQGCTCKAGNYNSGLASPQASLANPRGKPAVCQGHPTSQAAPRVSNRPKPSDVTEEGKLFERVSFESFDEATQR
jgi:hypothetical protein